MAFRLPSIEMTSKKRPRFPRKRLQFNVESIGCRRAEPRTFNASAKKIRLYCVRKVHADVFLNSPTIYADYYYILRALQNVYGLPEGSEQMNALRILHSESSRGWGGQEHRTLKEMVMLRARRHDREGPVPGDPHPVA